MTKYIFSIVKFILFIDILFLMNFPNKSIFVNKDILQQYLGKVKEGYGLTESDKDNVMKAFYRIHDKLFDQEIKFNQSEISQLPIQVSYHQLNKILFIYFLYQLKNNKIAQTNDLGEEITNVDFNLNANQSAKNIVDRFNALKYSHTILFYFWWLIHDFYPNQIEKESQYLAKNLKKMPDFQKTLQNYGIKTGQQLIAGEKTDALPFHNLINLVLVYGKYLDETPGSNAMNSSDESQSALYFYRQFISAENQINDLLAKYDIQSLYPITDQPYSLWEKPIYRNYYFRYMIYLSQFYDIGYENLSQVFQKKQHFTYRIVKDHLLVTGFDPVNLTNHEYLISDTLIQKNLQKLIIHNLVAKSDVTISQTIKKILAKNTRSLSKSYDTSPYGTWTMSYDNTQRQFTVRLPVEGNSGRRRRSSKNNKTGKMDPLNILKPPSSSTSSPNSSSTNSSSNTSGSNASEDVQVIKIKIAQETVGGKSKTVMEVYLNDSFLYVFFKQDQFFSLLRRCDGKIIGKITENINGIDYFKSKRHQPSGVLDKNQELAYAQTDMLFPFEYVVFNYCCQALVSKFSTRLDNIASQFFRQIRQVFQPKPGEAGLPNTSVGKEGKRVDPKCLFVYSKFPYLKNEYIKLMKSN